MPFKVINELVIDYLAELALNDGFERTEFGLSRNLGSEKITARYHIALTQSTADRFQIVSPQGDVAFLLLVRWEELEAIVEQLAPSDYEIGPFTFATATDLLTIATTCSTQVKRSHCRAELQGSNSGYLSRTAKKWRKRSYKLV